MNRKEFLLLMDDLVEADPGTLTGSENLSGLEEWNSLAVMEFIALVDEKFGVQLNPTDIEQCTTTNDLIALLGDHIRA